MSARVADLNGWFQVPRNPIARAGVFPYSAKVIQAPGWEQDPNRMVMVYRPELELADPDAIESFKLLPWVHRHAMLGDPTYQDGLTPAEDKGVHGTLGEQIEYDSDDRVLYGNLKLWSSDLADAIDMGEKELSIGFRCVYEFANGNFEGQPYQAIQRKLRGNHIALVPDGRMGPDVAVLDENEFTFTFDAKEIVPMPKLPKITRLELIRRKLGLKDMAAAQAFLSTLDAEEEDTGPSMSLDDAVAMLKDIAPKIGAIQEALGALGGAAPVTDADPDVVGDDPMEMDPDEGGETDMEPVLDDDGVAVMDAAGKPMMKKKAAPTIGKKPAEGIAAQDAKELGRKLAGVQRDFQAFKANGVKSFVKEIAARDALANKVSEFVGTFDHSEMTLVEVAAYGVDRLAIPGVAKGAEIAAVNAYLVNRTAPRKQSTFAMDQGEKGAKASASVDSFLAGSAA